MAVQKSHILGKILSLLKEYRLSEPDGGDSRWEKFITGTQFPGSISGGIGITWWITKRGDRILRDIADMAIRFDPRLRGADLQSLEKQIRKAMQKNALNKSVFVRDAIFLGSRTQGINSVYDARSDSDELRTAEHLWRIFHTSMIDSMNQWLIFYPLHKTTSDSHVLGFEGIELLSVDESSRYSSLSQRFPSLRYEDLRRATSGRNLSPFHQGHDAKSWLVCEVEGTEDGARRLAQRRMRKFIAVLSSHLDIHPPTLLRKSMANPVTYSAQFPADSSSAGCACTNASIGVIFPRMLHPVSVSTAIMDKVSSWYNAQSQMNDEISTRATTAAFFINRGIATEDIEQFVHMFISLDALFGVRDDVERRIVDGVKKAFGGDSVWGDKASRLYKLRSELVHGGCAYLEDWKDLGTYRNKFDSEPWDDVAIAAMKSLRTYFD